jgi:hypothetical protein
MDSWNDVKHLNLGDEASVEGDRRAIGVVFSKDEAKRELVIVGARGQKTEVVFDATATPETQAQPNDFQPRTAPEPGLPFQKEN